MLETTVRMESFKEVEEDLERIKDLGVDIIWLMPIHPIGVKNKKGSLWMSLCYKGL